MITLAKATKAIEKGVEKAKELNVTVSISVIDSTGIEIAFVRMEGSFPVSPVFARTKAYTSATLSLPTDGIGQYSSEGKPYYGIESLDGGKFTTIAGGIPVISDGKTLGAIGVGGSADTSQDSEIAKVILAELA